VTPAPRGKSKRPRWTARVRAIQEQLERLYALECGPYVIEFVRPAKGGAREQLLIRENEGSLELSLELPRNSRSTDAWLQTLEGVSHFVYIVERARTGLPATQLELELQAEVDKFVLMALQIEAFGSPEAHSLHELLYDRVSYLHAADTEAGERYRLANQLAARFVRRVVQTEQRELRLRLLRRFYRSGQTEKIALARAA
jgi:hypothetical protein